VCVCVCVCVCVFQEDEADQVSDVQNLHQTVDVSVQLNRVRACGLPYSHPLQAIVAMTRKARDDVYLALYVTSGVVKDAVALLRNGPEAAMAAGIVLWSRDQDALLLSSDAANVKHLTAIHSMLSRVLCLLSLLFFFFSFSFSSFSSSSFRSLPSRPESHRPAAAVPWVMLNPLLCFS
jgi:hypothetical protein